MLGSFFPLRSFSAVVLGITLLDLGISVAPVDASSSPAPSKSGATPVFVGPPDRYDALRQPSGEVSLLYVFVAERLTGYRGNDRRRLRYEAYSARYSKSISRYANTAAEQSLAMLGGREAK